MLNFINSGPPSASIQARNFEFAFRDILIFQDSSTASIQPRNFKFRLNPTFRKWNQILMKKTKQSLLKLNWTVMHKKSC